VSFANVVSVVESRSSRRTFCTFSPPAANYDFKTVEERVKSFWAKQDIYKRAKAQTDPKKKFFFVDGPPYTSGANSQGCLFFGTRGVKPFPLQFIFTITRSIHF
jgi:hypothetical protein